MRPVNLIPADERRGAARVSSEGGGKGVYVVLCVLAFAVLAAVLLVTTSNKIKDKDAELAQLTQQEQELKARSGSTNTDFASFEQIAQQQFDAVYTTAKDRFNFARRLRQFTRVVPDDVVINKLSAKLTADQAASGEAASAPTGSASAGPTFAFDGCTSDGKPGVARLATRMRNLDGVTKVEIKKVTVDEANDSTEPSSTNNSSSGTSTPAGSNGAGVCVGNNNTFEMQVTFAGPTGAGAGQMAGGSATPIDQANGAATQSEAANSAAGADSAAGGGTSP